MEKELISIIIPVYNMEKYLERCISSILSQTVNNFEAILIDDGSTDNSLDICIKYSQKDDRIKVYHQINQGVAVARNKGIQLARGKYIVFMDSDDYVEKDFILHCIENQGADLVIFGHVVCNNGCMVKSCINVDETTNNRFFHCVQGYNLVGAFTTVWAKMYCTDIIIQNNIHFTEGLKIGEDRLFNLLYLKVCERINFIKTYDYVYCVRESSASHVFYSNYIEAYKQIMYHQHSLFDDNTITSEKVKELDFYQLKKIIHDVLSLPDELGKRNYFYRQRMVAEICRFHEFQSCLEYKRKNGSLDEKVEVFCMRHKIYFLNIVFQRILSMLKKCKNN